MAALCPHCSEALSTYTTTVDREPTNIEVLVCAHCDKVLGVVGPARDQRRRMDVDEIADLLDVAVSTDDEGEARTVFSIAIDKIDSTIGGMGGEVSSGQLVLLLRTVLDRMRDREQKEQRQRGKRGKDQPW